MKYFSGFSLQEEASLFADYLDTSDFTVAGFSYGAQKALEYAYTVTTRIDRLILLSPAFFQTQKPSFVRAQLRYFETDKEAYVTQFLNNVSYPSALDISPYLKIGTVEDLEALLCYQWDRNKIETLQQRGVTIEVFIGKQDKIIQSQDALAFFKTTTHYILKDAGHLLRSIDD